MKRSKGFTLLELMIVVAILGILVTVATPFFQRHIIKSHATAALSEIASAKTGFEVTKNSGGIPSLDPSNVGFIGVTSPSTHCNISITSEIIECEVKGGNPDKFNGKIITLRKDSVTQAWGCTTDLEDEYKPKGCF